MRLTSTFGYRSVGVRFFARAVRRVCGFDVESEEKTQRRYKRRRAAGGRRRGTRRERRRRRILIAGQAGSGVGASLDPAGLSTRGILSPIFIFRARRSVHGDGARGRWRRRLLRSVTSTSVVVDVQSPAPTCNLCLHAALPVPAYYTSSSITVTIYDKIGNLPRALKS